MMLMNNPNFEEFRYKGSQDWTSIDSTLAARKLVYSPTGESSDSCDQRIATYLSTPAKLESDSVVVRLTEFSDDNGRPSSAVFDALIAESTGCRVIAANLPGVDYYSGIKDDETQELTPSQIESLKIGSFLKIGAAVMKAVHNATADLKVEQKYILVGSCMGGSLAAGAISVARCVGMNIKGLTIAEPTNIIDRSPSKMRLQFIKQPTVAGYSAMNPDILRNLEEPVRKGFLRLYSDRQANSAYANALNKNTLISDFGNIDILENVPVYMTRGGASVLCPEKGFSPVVDKFSRVARVESVTFGDAIDNPHNHPYCLTVQSSIDAINNIQSRQ